MLVSRPIRCRHARHRRGSVLMEFIIVFPIYLVLFGGVFMVGDMLVHATRLAVAERNVAFDVQPRSQTMRDRIKRDLFHIYDSNGVEREISDDGGEQDEISSEKNSQWYAGDNVDHPFSVRVASKLQDKYLLPVGGTSGRLLYAYLFLKDATPNVGTDILAGSDTLNLWRNQRITMHSKDESSRDCVYNYYTLKRTKYSKGFLTWRDNRLYSSDLVAHSSKKHAWDRHVYQEKWYEREEDKSNTKTFTSCRPEGADYQRYRQFVRWSE